MTDCGDCANSRHCSNGRLTQKRAPVQFGKSENRNCAAARANVSLRLRAACPEAAHIHRSLIFHAALGSCYIPAVKHTVARVCDRRAGTPCSTTHRILQEKRKITHRISTDNYRTTVVAKSTDCYYLQQRQDQRIRQRAKYTGNAEAELRNPHASPRTQEHEHVKSKECGRQPVPSISVHG